LACAPSVLAERPGGASVAARDGQPRAQLRFGRRGSGGVAVGEGAGQLKRAARRAEAGQRR
jgi:hypothetical protein